MKPPHPFGRRATGRVVAGVAASLFPALGRAAEPRPRFRVGVIANVPEFTSAQFRTNAQFVAFEAYLRDHGYRENLSIDVVMWSSAESLREGMLTLVQGGADVIVALGSEAAAQAARAATATIPIVVLAFEYDPVATGVVASLARSGNNITGVNVRAPELAAKRASLLLLAAPGIRRVVILSDPRSARQTPGAIAALSAAGIVVQLIEFRQRPYDYEGALGATDGRNGDGLLIMQSTNFFSDCDDMAEVALRHRLPSSYAASEFPTRGGLMSYGVDTVDMYRMVADYVARILAGAHPSDLPLQEPNKFELVINLKTANALGVTIPRSLLFLADDVIQ